MAEPMNDEGATRTRILAWVSEARYSTPGTRLWRHEVLARTQPELAPIAQIPAQRHLGTNGPF